LSPAEGHGEFAEITGPGHLALLDEAVVYPSRGVQAEPVEDDRAFDWAAVLYDDADWGAATDYGAYGTIIEWDGDDGSMPVGFPDATAHWIRPERVRRPDRYRRRRTAATGASSPS